VAAVVLEVIPVEKVLVLVQEVLVVAERAGKMVQPEQQIQAVAVVVVLVK
jgi:hypothetical protein